MISGIINDMWNKEVNTRRGPANVTLFSLSTDPEKTFNLGFGKPGVEVGDEVTFSFYGPNYGEYQVDKSTVKVNSKGNTTEKPASRPEPKKSYSRGNFPLDFTDGQRSILRQHAFTQASELCRSNATLFGGEGVVSVDEIIETAYKIERYTSGDDLREEM